MNMSILPADQGVFLQIEHVIVRRLRVEFEKEPADVGVEKSLGDVVRVVVVIDVLVMPAMLARPHEDGIFESARAEQKDDQTHRPFRLESFVREKPVITGGDAESGEGDEKKKHRDVKPAQAKKPKINRQAGHREKGRSDKERTCDPVNSVPR